MYRSRTSVFKGHTSAKYNFRYIWLYISIFFFILEFWHLGCPVRWLWKISNYQSANQHRRCTTLDLCSLEPVIDCRGICKYLRTVMLMCDAYLVRTQWYMGVMRNGLFWIFPSAVPVFLVQSRWKTNKWLRSVTFTCMKCYQKLFLNTGKLWDFWQLMKFLIFFFNLFFFLLHKNLTCVDALFSLWTN